MWSSPPPLNKDHTNTDPPINDEYGNMSILDNSDDGVLEAIMQQVTYGCDGGAPYVITITID